MKKDDFPEKRQYQRIKKNFILTYFDFTDSAKKYSASQLKNISLGGMCLVTEKSFPPQTRLGIDLKTPFLPELTHLEGIVLESHERIKDIIYETRMSFDPLPPETQFVLEKMIQHFEQEGNKQS